MGWGWGGNVQQWGVPFENDAANRQGGGSRPTGRTRRRAAAAAAAAAAEDRWRPRRWTNRIIRRRRAWEWATQLHEPSTDWWRFAYAPATAGGNGKKTKKERRRSLVEPEPAAPMSSRWWKSAPCLSGTRRQSRHANERIRAVRDAMQMSAPDPADGTWRIAKRNDPSPPHHHPQPRPRPWQLPSPFNYRQFTKKRSMRNPFRNERRPSKSPPSSSRHTHTHTHTNTHTHCNTLTHGADWIIWRRSLSIKHCQQLRSVAMATEQTNGRSPGDWTSVE